MRCDQCLKDTPARRLAYWQAALGLIQVCHTCFWTLRRMRLYLS